MAISHRNQELLARHLLANPTEISNLLVARKWDTLLILAKYAAKDVDESLARTDPALYRTLRAQITEFKIKWRFNIDELEQLANQKND
jgi:hypothetical protein